MANIVIYPKNIYSKPKYNLIKNNIIKNPTTSYYDLIYNGESNINYNEEYLPLTYISTISNIYTPISTIYHNLKYFVGGIKTWEIYNIIEGSIRETKENIDDNEVVNYYSYVILRKTIKAQTKQIFHKITSSNLFGNLKRTINFINTTWDPAEFNLKFFYKDFNPDDISLFLPINNHENYWFFDGKNYNSAYTIISKSQELEIYCIVCANNSKVEYQGTSNNINESAIDINYDYIFSDFNINLDLKVSIDEYKLINNLQLKNELKNDYNVEYNIFFDRSLALSILNAIVVKYENGRKSVTLSVYADNYYDENGVLIYDKTNGDLIRNGDIIKLYEYRNGGYTIVGGNTVRYKVTSSEFEYKGQPIIHLELLEEK